MGGAGRMRRMIWSTTAPPTRAAAPLIPTSHHRCRTYRDDVIVAYSNASAI